jgi:galactokinase
MKIEHTYAGTRCGLMDQLAIVTAKQGMFSLIDFLDENHPCISLIPAHTTLKDYTLTAIDSCVAHSLASGEYNKRRADCEKAVAAFNQHTKLNYNTLGQFCTQAAFEKLWDLPRTHSSIGQILQDVFPTPTQEQVRLVKRARHALSEILRVETAASALATNDLTNLASTMTAAHLSLCNDYEVSCSEIEALRSEAIQIADRLARKAGIESSIPAIIGPRLCGGGFGGSIVQLVHKSIAPDFTEHFRSYSDYEKHFAVKPKVMITSIANGISSSQRPHLAA